MGSQLQGHDDRQQFCTSQPYTGAIRGTVHEPQANLGADQKFSPVDVFKQKKGGQTLGFQ